MMAATPDRAETTSAALESVLARFRLMVRSVGLRHRLSDHDLDELVQEVRIRLWRASASSEQIETIGASYVYRTATTAALDLLRRRRAHSAAQTESMESTTQPLATSAPGPHDALESSETTSRILTAVDGLHRARRPVVRMFLLGYGREEIADLLGWSEAKTRNLLYRGLADLRERLHELGIDMEGAR